ncbi:MAG: hypothetical protein PHW63_04080 [Alphaproteobacteria bacterium]|nr:hypothetical protein [Alphaproteobacteria bacterium]
MAFSKNKAVIAQHFGNLPHAIIPRDIPLEGFGNQRGKLWVWLDSFFAIRSNNIFISKRRNSRPDTLLRLFRHPFARFF